MYASNPSSPPAIDFLISPGTSVIFRIIWREVQAPLLRLILIGLVVLTWSGCGKTPSPEPASQPAGAEPTSTPEPLHIFYRHDTIPRPIIERFVQETGIPVEVETYASNEQMLANLLSGSDRPDLIEPGEYVIEGLIKENLLLPLNHTALPNLKHLAPEFRNLPFDPGNVFSVPFRADTVGIVVNSDRVKTSISGYADVFSGANKGRIVVLDESREIMSWAFAVLNLPVDEVTDTNLEKAKPLLAKWLRQVKAYDSDHPEALLQNGEVDIGIFRNDSAAALMKTNPRFQWILPEEGSHLAVDSLCIPRAATQVDAALAFIDFLLRPEISAEISRTLPRLNPNLAAEKLIGSDPSPISFPGDEEFSRLRTFRDIGNQSLRVEEIINGLKAQ